MTKRIEEIYTVPISSEWVKGYALMNRKDCFLGDILVRLLTHSIFFLHMLFSDRGDIFKTSAPVHPIMYIYIFINNLTWVHMWVHIGCRWVHIGCRWGGGAHALHPVIVF